MRRSSPGSKRTGARSPPAGPEREHAIAVACRAKAATVAADERERATARCSISATPSAMRWRRPPAMTRPPRPWRGGRDRHGARPPLLGAAEPRPPDDARRVAAHLAEVGLPTQIDDIPGERQDAETLLALYRPGQEGVARQADLHPDPRHRPGLHRQRRRAGESCSRFLAEELTRGSRHGRCAAPLRCRTVRTR